jgi:cyclopropane fatty-acyl-phospholipid synthase-like methyltransferase
VDRRLINNPLSLAAIYRALDLLDLDASSTVLDVGCGRGEMLARALERYGCRGVGVDSKAEEIERARVRLAAMSDRVTLYARPIQEVELGDLQFRSAFCVGATHAYGKGQDGLPNTLAALKRIVEPGGTILIGEGFWHQVPVDAYLEATSLERTELRSHAENVVLAEQMGLTVLYVAASSREDWDHFESLTWKAAEDRFWSNPADKAAQEQVQHLRKWRDAYLRWGRDTLGFGLYLFRVPLKIA